MSDDQRIRRPEPARTRPIRSWSTFGGAGRSAVRDGAAPPDAAGADDIDDEIGRGVDQGYRLIDEYMRQGLFTARTLSDRATGAASGLDGLPEMTDQMLRQAGDMWMLWLRFVSSLGGVGPSTMPPSPSPTDAPAEGVDPTTDPHATPAPEAAPSSGFDAGSATLVTLHVDSARPLSVAVDVRAGPPEARYDVLDLRAVAVDGARLAGVTLEREPDGESLALRLRVPPDQPPGKYVGVVLDANAGVPRGTVCVTLPGPDESA